MNATGEKALSFSDRILYGTAIICFLSFKIPIIGVGDAGIRIDDLLMALAAIIILGRGILKTTPVSRPIRFYLIFVAINFFSTIRASFEGHVPLIPSLFYSTRLLQYLIFYVLGHYLAAHFTPIEKTLRAYVYLCCFVIPLQTVHLLPVPNVFGTARASANTNGPYEFAGVCTFLLCYLGFQNREKISGMLAWIFIIFSASRIAVMGLFVITYRNFRRTVSAHTKLILLTAGAVSILFAAIAINFSHGFSRIESNGNSTGLGRLQNVRVVDSSSDIAFAWAAAPVYETSQDYTDGAYISAIGKSGESGGDESALIRMFRWTSLIKSTVQHTRTLLFGMGPGFATVAVDGYYVRVFVETGIIGLIAFLAFIFVFFRQKEGVSAPFKDFLFAMLVTGLFIDIFTSYKVMLCLWLWHGMQQYKGEKRQGELDASRISAAA